MILELYLFIDPLSNRCYDAEQTIEKVAANLDAKVAIHFIPMLNIKILHEFSQKHPNIANNKDLHYNIISDYMAASFQGKKIGRMFLENLQTAIIKDNIPYCDNLVQQIALNSGLDLEMFAEDRHSSLARKTFLHDQQTVHRFNIKEPASVLVFCSAIEDHGLLLKEFDYDSLINLVRYTAKTKNSLLQDDHKLARLNQIAGSNAKLI